MKKIFTVVTALLFCATATTGQEALKPYQVLDMVSNLVGSENVCGYKIPPHRLIAFVEEYVAEDDARFFEMFAFKTSVAEEEANYLTGTKVSIHCLQAKRVGLSYGLIEKAK